MRRATGSAILFFIGVLGLSACEEGLNLGEGPNEPSVVASSGATAQAGEDVERPDIFTTTELALWDGRPSLGGVWAAHPDVTDPERAILINEATGQRVAGALFRRERENPGPSIQLSSDAAAALNVLAGQPTEMTVVAVRRVEIEVEEPDPEATDEEAGEETEGEDGAEADGDDGAAVAAAAAAGAAAAEAPPRRGNFLERLFGGRRNQTAADTETAAAAAAATAETAAAPEVETQTLDPVASSAAAAIARAEADDKPAPRPEQATPRPAQAAAPAVSEVRNPFIQVGMYSVEGNAAAAASNLRQEGIVPSVLEGERDGDRFWRVLVGPVTTADDQATILARVKRLGYADAFLAPN